MIDLTMESRMKQIFLLSMFAVLIPLTSPASAQPQSADKSGIVSINEPFRGELGYYKLDSQRWVVAVLTQESDRAKSTNRQAPSPFLITCSKEQISISGTPLFNIDKFPTGDDYEDVVAVTFCTELRKAFGVTLPLGF